MRLLAVGQRQRKVDETIELARAFVRGEISVNTDLDLEQELASIRPGYPEGFDLVSPGKVRRRKLGTPHGLIALVHSLAHIEWNAINLALDAAARFHQPPPEFHADWIGVAAEEALHFSLLRARLQELGADYGELPGHSGLWEMAERTATDLTGRMALVPRVLEARGLDVTPGLIERLRAVGDTRTVEILEVILRDEVGHVAIGSRWFEWACARDGREPRQAFPELVQRYMKGRIKGPFNLEARRRAGFSEEELADLLSTYPNAG
ncbi:MAG: uncharacterized ferritin-like protein (DUF455 family) [Hyphomicrobiaceae bacterium]|jgi:uncharacterized ferritin-like protein (DUF455 family)